VHRIPSGFAKSKCHITKSLWAWIERDTCNVGRATFALFREMKRRGARCDAPRLVQESHVTQSLTDGGLSVAGDRLGPLGGLLSYPADHG